MDSDSEGNVLRFIGSRSSNQYRLINSQDIEMTLREEIKSTCEYCPFEKCDYNARIANEICFQKLEYVLTQLNDLKQTTDQTKTNFLQTFSTL